MIITALDDDRAEMGRRAVSCIWIPESSIARAMNSRPHLYIPLRLTSLLFTEAPVYFVIRIVGQPCVVEICIAAAGKRLDSPLVPIDLIWPERYSVSVQIAPVDRVLKDEPFRA